MQAMTKNLPNRRISRRIQEMRVRCLVKFDERWRHHAARESDVHSQSICSAEFLRPLLKFTVSLVYGSSRAKLRAARYIVAREIPSTGLDLAAASDRRERTLQATERTSRGKRAHIFAQLMHASDSREIKSWFLFNVMRFLFHRFVFTEPL